MSEKIKVLHFLSQGTLGGQEKAQYHIIRGLHTDEEIAIGVAVNREAGLLIDKIRELGVKIIPLNLKNGFSLLFRPSITNEFRNYDIHHLHDPSPNNIIYSLLAGKKITRVFTRRGGIFSYSRFDIKKQLKFSVKKFLISKYFDGFSGNTQNAVESIKKQYKIVNKKIFTLYNGIDFCLFKPSRTTAQVRQELKIAGNTFLIGTACKLVDWKRVDLLIRAFSNVRISSKKLLIIGKGIEHQNLARLSRELGITDKVIFLGEVKDVENYLQILDCFVLPSGIAESFGNAIVEAMYYKIPCICMSDSEGLKEHIKDFMTGFVAVDENDLSNKIENIYSDSKRAKEIADYASKYVEEKYSYKNMAANLKIFYKYAQNNKFSIY